MPTHKRPFWKRKRLVAMAAGTTLMIGGIVYAIGPGAGWVVDKGADGQRIWRLGRLKIDGVTGSWLGNLRAEHVSIEDEIGVWLEGENVALDWHPLDIFGGAVRIDAASAEHISVIRQPVLLARRPSSGADWDIHLGALRIDDLSIAEDAFGAGGDFTLAAALDLSDDQLAQLDFDLTRRDSEADSAHVRYRGGAAFAMEVEAVSEPGGVIARAFGVGEQGFRLTGAGEGSEAQGAARFDGLIGDAAFLGGALSWTEDNWRIEGEGRLDALPALEHLAARIGPSVTLAASGALPGAFTAHAETPFLAVDVNGALNEGMMLDGAARVTGTANRLSDFARESPFELGAARFEGTLTRDDTRTTLEGAFDATNIEALGRRARFTGPLRAQLTSARFELNADLSAPENAPDLFEGARLRAAMDYDRISGRFELARTTLEGEALALNAQGWVNDGDGEFSGTWRVKKLETVLLDVTGSAAGNWRANAQPAANDERIWVITAEGDAANVGGRPDILPQLLGRSPKLDGMFRIENGGVTVSHLRVDGAQLRAGATGRIDDGLANLHVEASARGPLNIGALAISGVVDATGTLTGRLAEPTLEARAQLASVVTLGVKVVQPVIDFRLAPAGGEYRGVADVRGTVQGQPFTAESNVVVTGDGALGLPALTASIGALHAEGSARFAESGANADLNIMGKLDGLAPGLTGNVQGDVELTPEVITVDARIADAIAGELRVRAATIHATGPYDAISATFDLRGRLRRAPLTFAGTGQINTDGGVSAHIEGEGSLADSAISTRTPMQLTWPQAGGMDAQLDVTIADGAVAGRWQERGHALTGSATIENAPLAPLAAIWGERATGRIAGAFNLASSGAGLSGAADVNFIDARISGRQRGALTAHIVGTLTPTRLEGRLDARSSDGLEAHIEGNAPVVTSAAPIMIAIQPEQRGRAQWTINGPVEGLWSAARLADQSLEGQVQGQGELSFGAGTLSGDGEISIAGGRFEDKITGVKLENLEARIGIGGDGVQIERFNATDSRGGRITATGGSANPREGTVTVRIEELQLVDRPDARARGSGELTLAWEGLNSTLTGNLDIVQADVDIAGRAEAGIPQLDVIEINRPGAEDDMDEEPRPARGNATTLNVTISAPGRVFTRGRGVDAEWALDMRLAGTLAQPRIFGEARAVRGTLSLSGQPFEVQNARIFFNGDPMDARIDLTAERRTADLTAYIRLEGTAADPDITFTSNPALPEDEILPQILFGRSVADLNALEAAQLAASLAALSGQASFDLVDAARAAAGLDRFNVREDEGGGLLVAGGVYLTRDVYVEVARTGLGQAATRVEWTVRPQLVLITSFLPNGDSRASIRWRRETD